MFSLHSHNYYLECFPQEGESFLKKQGEALYRSKNWALRDAKKWLYATGLGARIRLWRNDPSLPVLVYEASMTKNGIGLYYVLLNQRL